MFEWQLVFGLLEEGHCGFEFVLRLLQFLVGLEHGYCVVLVFVKKERLFIFVGVEILFVDSFFGSDWSIVNVS